MDSQGMKNAKKILEKLGWAEGIIFFEKLYHGSALLHTKFLQYCLRQWTGFE
jgi:hypothetical protein